MTDGTVDDRAVSDTETVTESGTLRSWATVYAKGLAMGAADTVPGVSGGTIALITGIYERLITAVAGLDPRLLGELRGVHTAAGRRRLWEAIRAVDLHFLVVLGLGAVTSVVVLSRFLHTAAETYPAPTYAFFFGLIAASAVVLYGELSPDGLSTLVGAVCGFAAGFLVAGASEGTAVDPGLPLVLATGAITITAMVLPGISGAFILLLLGQYKYMSGVLERFVDAIIAVPLGGNTSGLAEGAAVVTVFGVGAVFGLLTVARVIRLALTHQRAATLAFLVSLMAGSLRLPVAEVRSAVDAWSPTAAALVVVPALVGGAGVLALDYFTDDLDLDAATPSDR